MESESSPILLSTQQFLPTKANGQALTWRFILLSLLGLFTLDFLLYGVTLGNNFFRDDYYWLNLVAQRRVWQIFWHFIFMSDANFIRPLVLLTWKLNFVLAGNNPFSYHLVSVILHLCNALLVLFFAFTLTCSRNTALLSASLFIIFPGSSDAVAWLSGRFELLSFFFYFLTLILFFGFLTQIKTVWLSAGGCIICALCSFLCKEMALTLPLTMLLYYYLIREKWVIRKSPRLVLIAMSILLMLYFCLRFWVFQGLGGYSFATGMSIYQNYNLERLKLLILLPWKILFPYYRIIFPDYFLIDHLSLIIFLVLLWQMFRQANIRRHLSFIGKTFVLGYIMLIPVINLFNFNPFLFNSRYYYFPGVVFLILLSFCITEHLKCEQNILKKIIGWQFLLFFTFFYLASCLLNNQELRYHMVIANRLAGQIFNLHSHIPTNAHFYIVDLNEKINHFPNFQSPLSFSLMPFYQTPFQLNSISSASLHDLTYRRKLDVNSNSFLFDFDEKNFTITDRVSIPPAKGEGHEAEVNRNDDYGRPAP